MHDEKHYENPEIWTSDRYAIQREQDRFQATADLLPVNASTLLDAGTGNGAFLKFLEDRASSYSLTGLDRSQAAIDAAVSRTVIQHGSIDNIPFEDRSFDVVSALEVIEHLPYRVYEASLQELERVAARYILISVPYKEKRVRMRCHYCSCEFNPYYHMRSFDETVMDNLFSSFKRLKFHLVYREDYILSPQIKAVYRLLTRNKNYISYATCPQCGFTGWDESSGKAAQLTRKGSSLHHFLSRNAPKYKRAAWIIALYERR